MDAKKRLIKKVGTEAERFRFLLNSNRLSANEKEKYRALIAHPVWYSILGERILAIDGSNLRLPSDKRERFSYISNDETKGYNLLHLDALYDVLQHVYIDASIQSKIGMNDHKALVSMIDNSTISDKIILIADRGYESFNNIAHCQEKNWNYIIRSKESYGIKFDTPSSETFDIDQFISLTRRQTKQTKQLIKKEPNRYRWIQPHTTFDYLKPKEDKWKSEG